MIFIDHMPGNPYESVTIRNFGFSDAAEAFFLMSGVAAGIAYSGAFRSRAATGLWPAVAPMWRRAWVLYLVQMVLTLAGIAMFAAAFRAFNDPDFLLIHNLRGVFWDPVDTLIGIPLLGHQIGYINILPTYSVLLLAGPLMILAGLKRPWLFLAASAALWFVAGLYRWNIPNFPGNGGWFFSPFCWQFLFAVGLLTGVKMREGTRLVPYRPALFWTAVAFLVLVLAWRHLPGLGAFLNHQMARLGSLGVPSNIVAHNKSYLGLPRLLHALALFYVVSCLPSVTRATGQAWAAPFRLMGRYGLLIFAAGTVLALFGQILFRGYPEIAALPWTYPLAGLVLLWGIAVLAESLKTLRGSRTYPREVAAGQGGGTPPGPGRRALVRAASG
ncbi:OpgC domain-containing protein [Rhodobacterales bacterium HKCCE2091]|nr:OpgC domain-containing protein [Rhodobacterales bacterium HKCCE2091]